MTAATPVMPGQGKRHEGELTPDLPLLRQHRWPYVTINGRHDGPSVAIIGGIHGCEYVSIRAAMRLARELDPEEVHGQVLVVPIVNLPAFWERTAFVNPYDGKNPNRVFPGQSDGTFSDQLAYFAFETFIKGRDGFVDLHGGDIVEELIPFSIYAADAAPDVSRRSREMAESFGLPYTIARREEPGALSGMTQLAAAQSGTPGLIAEAGGIGQLTEDDVRLLVDGSRRALQVVGTLPGTPSSPGTRMLDHFNWLYSREGGFWISDVRAGDEVRPGQRLGQLLSLLGEPVETVQADTAGVVIFRTTSAAVKAGGLLLGLGV
ncbi:MAG TPA: M14 family metallopeptidase [Thermomicrobiaceae bacterium]|nr:M14 family metallopeptidase [Thermomicrobiaceae bacterium]